MRLAFYVDPIRGKFKDSRPFIRRSRNLSDYMKARFGDKVPGVTIVRTTEAWDFLVKVTKPEGFKSDRRCTIGVINEPPWSNNFHPYRMGKMCGVVIAPGCGDSTKNGIRVRSTCPQTHWTRTFADPLSAEKNRPCSMISSDLRRNPHPPCLYEFRHWLKSVILDSSLDCDLYGRAPKVDPRQIGTVKDQADALIPYRRAIVVENSVIPGYHTEKLLDALLCGCQPIYHGDPLIADLYGDAVIPLDIDDPVGQLRYLESVPVDVEAVRKAQRDYWEKYNFIANVRDVALDYEAKGVLIRRQNLPRTTKTKGTKQ